MADEMSDRELNDLTDDCEQVSITSLWMNNEVWPGTTAVYEMDSNYPYVWISLLHGAETFVFSFFLLLLQVWKNTFSNWLNHSMQSIWDERDNGMIFVVRSENFPD